MPPPPPPILRWLPDFFKTPITCPLFLSLLYSHLHFLTQSFIFSYSPSHWHTHKKALKKIQKQINVNSKDVTRSPKRTYIRCTGIVGDSLVSCVAWPKAMRHRKWGNSPLTHLLQLSTTLIQFPKSRHRGPQQMGIHVSIHSPLTESSYLPKSSVRLT